MKKLLISLLSLFGITAAALVADAAILTAGEIKAEKVEDYATVPAAVLYDGTKPIEDYLIAALTAGTIPNARLTQKEQALAYEKAAVKVGLDPAKIVERLLHGETINLASEIRAKEKENGKEVKPLQK